MQSESSRERELRLEWLQRGKPPGQFSVERMEVLLAREAEKKQEGLGEEDLNVVAGSRLADKMDTISTNKQGEITVGKVGVGLFGIGKAIGKELVSLGGEVGGMFEPGFRKAAKNKKLNMARIAREDKETTRNATIIKQTRASLKELQAVELVKRAVNVEQIREGQPTAEITHKLKVDQEADERATEMEAFLTRRQLEVDEKVSSERAGERASHN